MADVTVQVKFNNVPLVNPRLRAGAANGLNTGLMAMLGYADPLTPIGKSGFLHTRITIANASPAKLTASATWEMFYAIYQHEGTRRGIKPKKFAEKGSARAQPALIAAMKAVGGQLA